MRATLLTLLSLCLAAPLAVVGCAADSSDSSENSESDLVLTGTAKALVGDYFTGVQVPRPGTVPSDDFSKLTLEANGKYEAMVAKPGIAMCFGAPCSYQHVIEQLGTWNASKGANGTFRLRLRATGETSRYYDAQRTDDALTITRAGQTQTLKPVPKACGGFAGLTCGSNEECVYDPGCDPANGGRDCDGTCHAAAP